MKAQGTFSRLGVYRTRGGGFASLLEKADTLIMKGELDGVTEFWSRTNGKHLPCAGIDGRPGRDLLVYLRPLSKESK